MPGSKTGYRGQYRWFQKKLADSLADAEMRIVNVEGHAFDPGIAATPLNIEEFSSEDALVVDQMLEPIIMGPDGVVRTGTVRSEKWNHEKLRRHRPGHHEQCDLFIRRRPDPHLEESRAE